MNPLEIFLKWEKETPDVIFLRQPFGGIWKTWTYRQAGDEARRLASAIRALNLPQESKIALLSKNCAHWLMADLAIMMTGFISVPLYPTLSAETVRLVLQHSEAALILIGKLDNYLSQKEGIPAGVHRIGISAYGIQEDLTWENVIRSHPPLRDFSFRTGDAVFTIKYTSGTTGGPKGVMHCMNAFEAIARVALTDLQLPMHPRLFSYLPMSHIAERAGIEMYGLYSGACFSFAESLETFSGDLIQTQPHVFFAVPRIWAKFQEKILEKIPQKRLDLLLSIPVVRTIVRKSIRKKLGLAKTSHVYTGAAAMSVDMLVWFDKLGITIFQALGMTEDSVYSHFNRHHANKFGTVGRPLTGVQDKISEDGELRIKTPGIMKGYYKDAELTGQAFDEDNYFRTGDLVSVDSEGYVTITGRLKDQFKTDKGKYISPAPIETALLASPDIEQVCVVGTGIPQPLGMITLSVAGKKKSKKEIEASIGHSLDTVNASLPNYEKLNKVVLLTQEWTIENGLITPTLKVKRNEVEKIFRPMYNRWYQQNGPVIWESDK